MNLSRLLLSVACTQFVALLCSADTRSYLALCFFAGYTFASVIDILWPARHA